MNIQDAYTNWSVTYDSDRNLTRDLSQVVTRNSLANLHCKSILEIGCGTGNNTIFLAQIAEKVRALDFSEGMIDRAKRKVQAENVTFAMADITTRWPCEDASADLVVCSLVLEHIENLSFIYSEAFRSLVAGGCFFVCELHPFRQYQGTKASFRRDGGTTEIQAFIHHISDFLNVAEASGLTLQSLKEWWHEEDQDKLPRLVSFMFQN
ncbi:MAG: class I SAM-dependent methyltransferase [Candidatus Eisenbacteria bacterium]|nr:class I SAM-dependent methyltransferase [Candidatus Eisenbacteria bacterium]